VFDAVELLGRLAVLVPRPQMNLILYHGVLGPLGGPAGWGRRLADPEFLESLGARATSVTVVEGQHQLKGTDRSQWRRLGEKIGNW
jgi:hypothetical protein